MNHHEVTFADEETHFILHLRAIGLRFAKLISSIRKRRVVLYVGIRPVTIYGGDIPEDEELILCSLDQFFISHVLEFAIFHQEHPDFSSYDVVLAELRRPQRGLPQSQSPCHKGTSAAACF
jgi:hypothetical protein